VSFHVPRLVQQCACGADCDWCIGANKARAAFPRARVPPMHDADTEHECMACFLKRPEIVAQEAAAGLLHDRCHRAGAGRPARSVRSAGNSAGNSSPKDDRPGVASTEPAKGDSRR
jgi:hypothetical protein